jgi:hypothetical protein
MTPEPISPRRPDNLYAPVVRYHRTHGSFGKKAKRRAVTLNADHARFGVVAAGTAATLGLGFLLGRAAQRFVTERTQRSVR